MTDITIPPEAVEVALEAFAHASGLGILPDDEHDEEWRTDLVNGMTAAILAALKAWPGMVVNRSWDGSHGRIVLPLPHQEYSDE